MCRADVGARLLQCLAEVLGVGGGALQAKVAQHAPVGRVVPLDAGAQLLLRGEVAGHGAGARDLPPLRVGP